MDQRTTKSYNKQSHISVSKSTQYGKGSRLSLFG